MNNQRFFDFLNNNLIKNAYLDTAMEETSLFLSASIKQNGSNTDASLLRSNLTLLQARLSHWHQTKAHTDSRTVTTEITKLYHDFIAFIERMDELPEINYRDFGQITVKEAINAPIGVKPTPEDEVRREAEKKYYEFLQTMKRFWWMLALWILFVVFGIGGGCKAIQSIMNSSSAHTPSTSNECNLNVYPGCKLYAQPDDNALIIMDVPMNQAFQPIDSQGKILRGEKVLFFKIKVENIEGWVKYSEMNLRKTPQCFEIEKAVLQKLSNSAKPSNNRISQNGNKTGSIPSVEDEFKKREKDFNREFEAHKREIEEGTNKAKQDAEQFKKEFDSKWKKQQ